jgi:cAMP-dependent protein kinase regulator
MLDLDPDVHNELVALVEEAFKPQPEAPPEAGSAVAPDAVVETPLFKDFTQEELVALISGLELRTVEPGEIVISAGEPGNSLFVLTTGAMRAYTKTKEGRHVQARMMSDGDFFGEISILTGNPRTATVTAVTRCDLLELDRPTLDRISKTHPHVQQVLQEFYSQRIKS